MSKLDINTEIKPVNWKCTIHVEHDVDMKELVSEAILDINGACCDCVIGFLYEISPIEVEAILIAEYKDEKVFITYELLESIDFDYDDNQLTVVSVSNAQTETEISEAA